MAQLQWPWPDSTLGMWQAFSAAAVLFRCRRLHCQRAASHTFQVVTCPFCTAVRVCGCPWQPGLASGSLMGGYSGTTHKGATLQHTPPLLTVFRHMLGVRAIAPAPILTPASMLSVWCVDGASKGARLAAVGMWHSCLCWWVGSVPCWTEVAQGAALAEFRGGGRRPAACARACGFVHMGRSAGDLAAFCQCRRSRRHCVPQPAQFSVLGGCGMLALTGYSFASHRRFAAVVATAGGQHCRQWSRGTAKLSAAASGVWHARSPSLL